MANKDIRLTGLLAERWIQIQRRFGYKTSIDLLEDLIYFFETNPVNPKQNFGGLLKDIENKIDEFHKDNNRVITVVRNIEKHKIDALYRILSGTVTADLTTIIKKLYEHKFQIPVRQIQNNSVIKNELIEIDKLKVSYESKLKNANDKYAFIQKEYDKITLEHGKYYNRLKNLSQKYVIEKPTFGKSKVFFEMSEDEFKNLISLK